MSLLLPSKRLVADSRGRPHLDGKVFVSATDRSYRTSTSHKKLCYYGLPIEFGLRTSIGLYIRL